MFKKEERAEINREINAMAHGRKKVISKNKKI